jgi:Lipocalin-like domain
MTDTPDIFGVWRLQSYYLETVKTGERIEPFGAKPKGVLILHPEGRMVAMLTPAEQTPPVSEADQVNAFQKLVAYSGLYRLEPPDRFVTLVDIAWFQPWVGTEQARTFSVRGDTLDIVSARATTPLTGDALVVAVLSWVRESSLEPQEA